MKKAVLELHVQLLLVGLISASIFSCENSSNPASSRASDTGGQDDDKSTDDDNNGGDGDSDSDTDADGDADADADGDSDGDGDGDSDGDSDGDTDDEADGGGEDNGDGGFNTCAETTAEADEENARANLIITVDTSGSMNKETALVQENINNRFAEKFGASPDVDVHIILIAKGLDNPSGSGDGICVAQPLGSGNCPVDTNPSMLFWHIRHTVSSTNSLEKIIDCSDGGGGGWFACAAKWQDFASPGGFTHFVVVSDDDSDMSAAAFTTWAQGLYGDNWMFHGIVAKTDNSGPGITPECDEYAYNEGSVYKELITQTGGVFGDLCLQENNEFDLVFDQITTAVVTHSTMSCEWTIPDPPDDDELDPDEVNVEFVDGTINQSIGKVAISDDCANVEHGWYYDDPGNPTKIFVCSQTCDWIQGRPDAEMNIKFGCATEEAPPII